MGCCESGSIMSQEEYCISLHSGTFFFHGKPCRDIEFALRRYSRAGILTEQQVNAALKGVNIQSATGPSEVAWNRMKVQNSFPEGRLIAMAMLLGDGELKDKFGIIYDVCDPDMVGSATRQLFFEYIADIVFVATQVIPFAAVGSGENKIKLDQMAVYLANIKRIIPSAQENLTQKVFGSLDVVPKSVFCQKFIDDSINLVCSSYNLRKYLLRLVKDVPITGVRAGSAPKAKGSGTKENAQPAPRPKASAPPTSTSQQPPKIELYIHYMCPFARRALYTLAFKGLKATIIECDQVTKKPDRMVEINPNGSTPCLIVQFGDHELTCYDSLQVMEVLDEIGQNDARLFPVNPYMRAKMRNRINEFFVLVIKLLGHYKGTPNEQDTFVARAKLKWLLAFCKEGSYLAADILGKNEISAVDMAIIPFIESYLANEDYLAEVFNGFDLRGLRGWYRACQGTSWMQQYLQPVARHRGHVRLIRSGLYRGHALPVSRYEEAPELTTNAPEPVAEKQAPEKPAETPTKPTETSAKPTETSAKPTEASAKPTQAPAKPTQAPTKPTQAPAKPTQSSTPPTSTSVPAPVEEAKKNTDAKSKLVEEEPTAQKPSPIKVTAKKEETKKKNDAVTESVASKQAAPKSSNSKVSTQQEETKKVEVAAPQKQEEEKKKIDANPLPDKSAQQKSPDKAAEPETSINPVNTISVTSEYKIELLIHYMCPFARRALYALAYKNLSADIEECDLVRKSSERLRAVNPNETVPSLIIKQGNDQYSCYESMQILEIIDELGGAPFLYPRNSTGEVDPYKRAMIRNRLEQLEQIKLKMFFHYKGIQKEEDTKFLKQKFIWMNRLLAKDAHFTSDILGENVPSAVDIAMLPLFESYLANEKQLQTVFKGVNLSNIKKWYRRLISLGQLQSVKQSDERHQNHLLMARKGVYKGHTLPMSIYDEGIIEP